MSSFSISGAISGAAVGGKVGGWWGALIGAIVGGFGFGDQERKARNRARDAWNNAQRDRQLMIQSATAPHKIIYGRDRVSGPLVYAQSTGAKSEYLHLVVALAGHECDAIETVYLGETALTLDGNGFATNASLSVTTYGTLGEQFTTSGVTLALSHAPSRVLAVYQRVTTLGPEGDSQQSYTADVSITNYTVAGNVVTLGSSSPDTVYFVSYEYVASNVQLVRVRKYLGTATQTADADLVAESGGKWTSAHRLRGICYVYVRLQYDQNIFGAIGQPDILATVRGRKVYDPRTGLTAWTPSAALCAADYLRNYMGATQAEVPDAELSAEANICGQAVTLTAGGATQERYTVNGTLSTETAPRENLEALLEAMAGTCVWVQGRYLLRAGAHRASELTITEDLLADGPITIQQGARRSELVNRIVPLYQEPLRLYTKVEAPAVTNATYVSDDGGLDLPLEVHFDLCDDSKRAQRLAKIMLERARQGLRVQLNCNLLAYDLAPGSTVALTLARYGWSGKLFTVLERSHDIEAQQVALTLQETASAVWDWNYGEATTVDLTPNTNLPSPWARPPSLTGLAVASGTQYLLRTRDGTLHCQALVTWTAGADVNVLQGGQIRVRWKQGNGEWVDGSPVAGNSTRTLIGPLREGMGTVVGLLPITQLEREAEQWSYVNHIPVGASAAPSNVTGLAYVTQGLNVVLSWAANTEVDYDFTELRVGASWAAGTALVSPGPTRVTGTSFNWARPANGSYTVWAAHRDTSGNYSAASANLAITVSATIDSSYSNSVIAIDASGQITGIGTGNNTVVENAKVTTDLANVVTAAKGDGMIGHGGIVSIFNGVLSRHASLDAAAAAIGSNRCTVIVRSDLVMAANTAFPVTSELRIENRAVITTTGYTLTINGRFSASSGQCFAGSGYVIFGSASVVPVVYATWFGALGDGVTDDTTALTRWATSIASMTTPCIEVPPGIYKTTSGIGIDLPDYASVYLFGRIVTTATGTALRLGKQSSPTFGVKIEGVDVRRSTYDTAGSSIGVEIKNLVWSTIQTRWIEGFYVGLLINGVAANGGVSHCRFMLGYHIDSRYNVFLTAGGSGYCNENSFFGGSFGYTSAWGTAAGNYNNTTDLYVDSFPTRPLNNNRFFGPSFEAASSLTVAAQIYGEFTHIYSPRMEVPAGFTPTDFKINIGSVAIGTVILGGMDVRLANITDDGHDSLLICRDGTVLKNQADTGGTSHLVRLIAGDSDTKGYAVADTGGTVRAFMAAGGTVQGTVLRASAAPTGVAGTLAFGAASQSTVGAAGSASALPAQPSGYLRFFYGTTEYVIPYYAKA